MSDSEASNMSDSGSDVESVHSNQSGRSAQSNRLVFLKLSSKKVLNKKIVISDPVQLPVQDHLLNPDPNLDQFPDLDPDQDLVHDQVPDPVLVLDQTLKLKRRKVNTDTIDQVMKRKKELKMNRNRKEKISIQRNMKMTTKTVMVDHAKRRRRNVSVVLLLTKLKLTMKSTRMMNGKMEFKTLELLAMKLMS